MADEERKQMTPAGLCDAIERFMSDNARSHDLDNRWLAREMEAALAIARAVRNGGRLEPELKARVNAFRIMEIEAEMSRKRRELDVLESDLKTIKKSTDE
jgi:hypothetical protein